MYCSSEDMPALAFYIQGTVETCTYVIYHIVMTWIAAFLITAWFVIAKIAPEPNNYSSRILLYFFISLLFGLEGAAIFIIVATSMPVHQQDTSPSAPPIQQAPLPSPPQPIAPPPQPTEWPQPTAPEWPRIDRGDIAQEPSRNFP